MHRTWLVVVAGVLLGASGAAASLGAAGTEVADVAVVSLAPQADLDVPGITAPLESSTGALVDQAIAAVQCQDAVRVPVAFVWGDITKHRTRSLDVTSFVSIETLVGTVRTPVYETVTEVIGDPDGLLGLLPPVTREVTRLVGFDETPLLQQESVPVDLQATWREEYWDFDAAVYPVHLALPVGAPFLGTSGELVRVCNGETVHLLLPEFPNPGHDDWDVCIGCSTSDADELDGWYIRVINAMASPASGPVTAGAGWTVPAVVTRALDAEIASFVDERSADPEIGGFVPATDEERAQASSGAFAATAGGFSAWAWIAAVGVLGLGGFATAGYLRRFE